MEAGISMTRADAIAEITRRLIEMCSPVRIYLFGSVARGDATAESDLDILVVVADDAPEEIFRSGKLVRALWGVPFGADVIPWRETDFEGRAAFVAASLPATVMREGKLLYDARRVAA
jgi:predicted nucleotidyltransferase